MTTVELPTEERKREMVESIRRFSGCLTQADFARKLGISSQNACAWAQRGTFNAELVAAVFPEISGDWLLTGKGEMLKGARDKANGTPKLATPLHSDKDDALIIRKTLDALAEEQRLSAKSQAQADKLMEILHDMSVAIKRGYEMETCKKLATE